MKLKLCYITKNRTRVLKSCERCFSFDSSLERGGFCNISNETTNPYPYDKDGFPEFCELEDVTDEFVKSLVRRDMKVKKENKMKDLLQELWDVYSDLVSDVDAIISAEDFNLGIFDELDSLLIDTDKMADLRERLTEAGVEI